jgi:hypothetical protein
VQVQKIERLRLGLDLGIDDLALQRDLAADVEDRFLRIEQRAVEDDRAVLEVSRPSAQRIGMRLSPVTYRINASKSSKPARLTIRALTEPPVIATPTLPSATLITWASD